VGRRGRIDIFVEKNEDFVTIIEVKSTNWNRVSSHRRRPLLASHRRQIERYVDQYVDGAGVNVCAAVVYPKAPTSVRVASEIEGFWHGHGFQVVWYDA
jgi:hypothetical protein